VSGKDITSGRWMNNLVGNDNSLITKLGSLTPLFNLMPLRQDINL